MKTLLTIAVALLYGCGGQAEPMRVFNQPTDRVITITGYASQIQQQHSTDPVEIVAKQAALSGNVILYVGFKEDAGIVERFPKIISEAKKHPGKFTHVYIIDELYWDGKGINIGLHDAEVTAASKHARDNGLKTVATIMPDVILHPDFRMPDINMFDGISIDVYPSIRPTKPNFGSCKSGLGEIGDLLHCSIQKLRSMGFTGQIGYIYQAFGLHTVSEQELFGQLVEQRNVIKHAGAMGVDYTMAWGLHLGAPEIAREPHLYQLAGTKFEWLVTGDMK